MEGQFGQTPIMVPPMFAGFSLFLISTHFENLIHLAVTVYMFKFWRTQLRGIPNLAPPISVALYSYLISSIAQRLNTVRLAV